LSSISFDPLVLLKKYYDPDSEAFRVLVTHSEMVTQKALELAEKISHLNPNRQFIHEASMLHDIGILFTDSPQIGCFGNHPYVLHGTLGRELLEKEGYPRHALVCERHVGTGFSKEDIIRQNLPLPHRDMLPVSLEEQIICFADKFFTKKDGELRKERSIDDIRKDIARHWNGEAKKIDEWIAFFGL
jgi:uncharacterized protein